MIGLCRHTVVKTTLVRGYCSHKWACCQRSGKSFSCSFRRYVVLCAKFALECLREYKASHFSALEHQSSSHTGISTTLTFGLTQSVTLIHTFAIQARVVFDNPDPFHTPSHCSNSNMSNPSADKGKGKATDTAFPMLEPVELQIDVLREFVKEHYPVIYIRYVEDFNRVVDDVVQKTLEIHHWNDDFKGIVETAIFSTSIISISFKAMGPAGSTGSTPGLIPQIPDGLKAICGQLAHLQMYIGVHGVYRIGQPADVFHFLTYASMMPGLARIMPELKSITILVVINTGCDLVRDSLAGYWKDLDAVDPSAMATNDWRNKTVETVIEDLLLAVKAGFPSKNVTC